MLDSVGDGELKSRATLTCPVCDAKWIESMPTDCCVVVYDCRSCGAVLRPKPGDCCVFCSYADQPCPPVQTAGDDRDSLERG